MTNKKHKKTTIRKQFSKSMMSLIFGVFLVLIIVATVFTYNIVSSLSNLTISMISTGVEQQINTLDFDAIWDPDTVEAKEFNLIKRDLTEYRDEIKYIIDDFFIITTKKEELVYLYGLEDGKEINMGEQYNIMDKDLMNTLQSGQEYHSNITAKLVMSKQPIKLYIPFVKDGETKALLGIHLKTDIIMNVISFLLIAIIGTLILAVVIMRVLIGIIAKRQTQSIEKLLEKMKKLSKLEGDLTKRIQIKSNNEIGELAQYTNQLLDTIQNFMLQMRQNATTLSATSSEFTAVVEETAASSTNIEHTIEYVTNGIDKQMNATNEVSTKITEINEIVNQVALHAQKVTDETIKTNKNANEGKKAMEDMKDYVQKAVSQVESTGTLVTELNNLSRQINTIVDAITNIASQTNLLALNASIEAARAGENGKGFAVVADEVRKLAEESAKQAEDISSLIHRVQESIQKAGQSMDEAIETMETENTMVDQVASKFVEIVNSIQAVSEMVEEVSSASQEMAASSSVVTEETNKLSDFSKDNANKSNEVAQQMFEQNESIQQLANDIEKIDNIALNLSSSLEKLTLD